MSMNIDTTRFAAAAPVAEAVDFGAKRREELRTAEHVNIQLNAQRFAADYAAHAKAMEARLKLNVVG